ncbi:histone chaperone ASF1A isoform X1 [Pelodiscus sinensis]|uniref:histone chaperone ASF1A isoform X1 n=1 Tax=Pelodiscus sinensis TaxID=13735 RepID=UPI003F6D3738
MAKVQVNNVVVLDNPSPFYNPFQFEITFECIEDLSEEEHSGTPGLTTGLKEGSKLPPASLRSTGTTDLEWKIIYVGSAESEEYDQVLDSVLVGPVPAGRHMFVFQADAPNPGLIPDADAVGVTVVLITCTYRGQEFIRVGYYVNNEYTETELRENPPVKPDFSKLQRNILASNPRVTRFHINWEDNTEKLEDAESSNQNLQSLLSTDALPSASKGWSTSENSLNVMLESHMDCM